MRKILVIILWLLSLVLYFAAIFATAIYESSKSITPTVLYYIAASIAIIGIIIGVIDIIYDLLRHDKNR